MARIHHSAICTSDVEASMRFWCEGLGLEVLMDARFPGDWPALFDAPARELRAVFLGDPARPDDGIVELVSFDDATPDASATAPVAGGQSGFLLLSLYADLDEVLPRLATLGVGGEPRIRTVAPNVRLAVVRDPNGVLVELMDAAARTNLTRLREV
jgi:catechol 2,3-dioxygenase-like lactoylglutathione lyase family enzyme